MRAGVEVEEVAAHRYILYLTRALFLWISEKVRGICCMKLFQLIPPVVAGSE